MDAGGSRERSSANEGSRSGCRESTCMTDRQKISAILGIVVIGVLGYLLLQPAMTTDRHKGPLFNILNNLRQIDGAKHGHALEQGITNPAHVFSEADLAPYLGRTGEFPVAICAEKYFIKPISASPEALLTRKLTFSGTTYAPGTILRLTTNGGWEALPPNPR